MTTGRTVRVGFVPAGPIASGSSRLQVYLPYSRLKADDPGAYFMLRNPKTFSRKLRVFEAVRILSRVLQRRISTVVFRKVHKGAAPRLMALLRKLGCRVIYVECDARSDLSFVRSVAAVVAPSRSLSDHITSRTGVRTIHIPDPVEYWDREKLEGSWIPKPRYRCVWVGGHKNWHQIAELKADLAKRKDNVFDIVTISDHAHADIRWNLKTIRQELSQADVGIIPTSYDLRSSMKSHNRATLFMALGLPVIVGKSDVYSDLVRHDQTGFVYADTNDLLLIAERLASPKLVTKVRANAMRAAEAYSLDRIAEMWRDLLQRDCKPLSD